MPADTLNHPEPLALYTLTDQRAPFAFACSVCRAVHIASDIDPAWAKRHASICCSTVCDACGGSKPARGYCAACSRAREEKREAEMFAKAARLPADVDERAIRAWNRRVEVTQ